MRLTTPAELADAIRKATHSCSRTRPDQGIEVCNNYETVEVAENRQSKEMGSITTPGPIPFIDDLDIDVCQGAQQTLGNKALPPERDAAQMGLGGPEPSPDF